jgi:hypothetical protein
MLSLIIIGMRDIIPAIDLLPVKKLFCKFDISGDTKDAVITSKHPVIGGSCNFLEIVSIEIDVPLNLNYAPVLTVYVYDNIMGILGTRLVGVTNIPLEKYCKIMLDHMHNVANVMNNALHGGNAGRSPLRLTAGNMNIVSPDSIELKMFSGAPLID